MPYSIAELNQLDRDAFVAALGAVFEDMPAIAHQAWEKRPFADVNQLHQAMVHGVRAMSQESQLALIQAHPDLGSKAKMAAASVQEQAGVGLDRLTTEEFERFQRLNQTYKGKFGFPFIIAVKNHTKTSILEAFDRRLQNDIETEITQALAEIAQIAHFRLMDRVEP
ncbi:2-oxo-4-hydroxy-4-carboxy-5-ureidoimidazoline decarboxylase [Kovacikia minuta CCNUW1]|uniref:2-oxo-4-hydroxy-4-carboxy-5-ureidoimidazoline decarboxylase n=1 Tax=Kovacikia minuta TaxID=2931930 RepID=UPI001CCF5C6D|nr:2-oxo-4-hydroxy-4-carboxy-5-ureidoimidazoline decarboxylase [Kovacikia minuta]UBF23774.1 2-oxo-4-hydroxy-4-carboxy-5-ureidoimidazoline decarboxylase [Kovacikia minuta CCNUW1]